MMFEPSDKPRLFALPPGVDFPAELIKGLDARLAGQSPEALARVQLIVNTRRMERRIRDIYDTGPARLLPRLSLVTDTVYRGCTDAVRLVTPVLRRRLELAQLISVLLKAQPDLAAQSSLYHLADSLAALMDEMQGEGVSTQTIRDLDVSDMSGHWARAQQFIGIVDSYLGEGEDRIDPQAQQRAQVEALVKEWAVNPPSHPVILAGSTGSRGTTLMLIDAVARLPQGAVILPGFDFDQPQSVWDDMADALVSEDHPQFRFYRMMETLGLNHEDVQSWTEGEPPSKARNRLVSLALRPAPYTHAWLEEGPHLQDIAHATGNLTLVEAPGPRAEALAIAMRLRQAVEDGQTAALITPDRMLTRRVSAALDQWRILPDDSAGLPLQLSPPGRFLRHVAQLFTQRLNNEKLMALLKHPLCHSGAERGEHLLLTRDLELFLRKNGPPFPDAESLGAYQTRETGDVPPHWIDWLVDTVTDRCVENPLPLGEWIETLVTLAEKLAAGSRAEGSGGLWEKNAGQKALSVIAALRDEAEYGGEMTAREFTDLLGAVLSGEEVRDRDAPHPQVLIWGTLEARVQGADLLILGGLNEGTWPEAPSPDPWLNRKLRHQAGLLLPERRIGLSAHDFQLAVAAPEVWLTRSERSEDSETIPSRWLNRITNLLQGLPEQGRPALEAMRNRGRKWVDWAEAMEEAEPIEPAKRPSPRPPVAARPRKLSVTEIKRLIRDPYAVYAKHVLRLRPLDPLVREPDALLRGIVVHEILEHFVKETRDDPSKLSLNAFLEKCSAILEEKVSWPVAKRLWQARMKKVAEPFVESEIQRQSRAIPLKFEVSGGISLAPLDFRLTGQADRIDQNEAGELIIYDYKTGTPPSASVQAKFDKQLLIEAAMAEQGAFDNVPMGKVIAATFIGLGSKYNEVEAPLVEEPPEKVLAELRELIGAYFELDQGFTSRRALQKDTDAGDYDQLARFGEWDRSAPSYPEDLT